MLAGATFSSASVTDAGPGLYLLTLNLTGVANGGVVTVTLNNLADAAGNALAGDRDVSVRSLLGDVDGSGRVDAVDALAVRGAPRSRRRARGTTCSTWTSTARSTSSTNSSPAATARGISPAGL